jgi:hypothetical protein
MSGRKNYRLDKMNATEIGNTKFIVSSFLKADSPMTFLKIVEKMIDAELSA